METSDNRGAVLVADWCPKAGAAGGAIIYATRTIAPTLNLVERLCP